ncbi:MAG: transcription-repair coupling factor, partial [Planctomycetota bacterium]
RFFLEEAGRGEAVALLTLPAAEPGAAAPGGSAALATARLATLRALADPGRLPIVLAPAAALLQPLPAPETLAAARCELRVGERLDLETLEARLLAAGFARMPMAEVAGEWSRRGGIVDIIAFDGAPLRIELFGDEIDTLRSFDPESQRSIEHHEAVTLTLLGAAQLDEPPVPTDLFAHLRPDTTVAVIEPDRVAQLAGRTLPEGERRRLEETIERRAQLEIAAAPPPSGPRVWHFETRSVEHASGLQMHEVVAGVEALVERGCRVTVLARREAERNRLRELLVRPGRELVVRAGEISRGFEDPAGGRALLCARELFRRPVVRSRAGRRRRAASGRPITSFLELRPGEHVVHLSHGIGRFVGIETIENREGYTEDFLKLEYAEGATVFVPTSRIELVQRYVGTRGARPRLSRIGTGGWRKRQQRVRRAVLDLAAELLETQARRQARPGIAHPPGGPWLEAFEAAFPFELTPDQAAAWEAIRADLEAPRPCDRLVCGDVGYGKTELAMRAAFQVAIGGRQVAVLVPTTVLAEQHLRTFRSRMAAFPVRVACLDRFRTAREQREILAQLAEGEIDILIGTHRLLSGDVRFRDVGLLIIDEEQRFGVAHKEQLKRLRATVDILTLTATPIPRTLHLALVGIKDISALETAPTGRMPIRTVIARDAPELVERAIRRELAREGQTYVLHNRVGTIERRASEIARLVPEARIEVVHGQMPERRIAAAMGAFVRGEADVLVATTIIESGLDIPRANTLIIDRADRFGLAELHQLRGRVGRYTEQAYAYLLLPRRGPVREEALRRLKALEELNQLGAGFRIAMRDLEIRGAGNILGTAQSGHIAQVGYDLYCRMLQAAVQELEQRRDEREPPQQPAAAAARPRRRKRDDEEAAPIELPVSIELRLDAHLPADWIPHPSHKLDAYRLLATAHTEPALADAHAALRDRYGPLPPAARRLVRVHRLRLACERLGIERVQAEGKVAIVHHGADDAALREALRRCPYKVLWPEPGVCYIVIAERPEPPHEEVLERLLEILETERRPETERGRSHGPKRSRGRRRAAGRRSSR